MNVLIDNREKQLRIDSAVEYYEKMGDEVHVRELPFGDYIFENQVVFEYKTLSDFAQSVQSGRVFNQAIDQSQAFPHHFVIVVSTYRERRNYFRKLKELGNPYIYFDEKRYMGAISRLNTFTTVIQAYSQAEAFKFMRVQARKCLDNKHVVKRLKQKTDNPAFNWLMNIKHISDAKAEVICNHLELKCLDDLLNVTNDDLQKTPGIGSQTAGIILKSIRKGQ